MGFKWSLKWTQVVTPLDLARGNRVHIHYMKICAIILWKHAYCKWCSCVFQCYFSSLESEWCLCRWLMVCLTHNATCICHKHTAATAFVGMFSETWSHLLTQTCFYLTDLEWLPLNSATATILLSPTDPNCANHWRQTPVFSLFLKKPPDSWVIKNIVPCCVLLPSAWCCCGVGASLDSLFGSLKGGCQD